jgi:hypothetical protein
MPEQAKVTSIEALESFRTSLIIYLEKALRVLDEISDEVMRTRGWLETDRRMHWEREVRQRSRKLDEKEQELFSARLSNLREATQAELTAVTIAKRSLTEAESSLARVRQWNRQYESRVQPLAKEVDKLRDVLVSHMGKAVIYLSQTMATLHAYAEMQAHELGAPKPPASGQDDPASGTVGGNS